MPRLNPGKPIDLLIIEDNSSDVLLLEEAFQEVKANIRVQVARDGAEGLQMVEKAMRAEASWHPDMILLDLNLPKISGHEVLARLKGDPATRQIPVLILTSSSAPTDIQRAYNAHCNAYLNKPSTLDALFSTVADITSFWTRSVTLPA